MKTVGINTRTIYIHNEQQCITHISVLDCIL